MCIHINTDSDQWKRIESPEINSQIYGQLICDTGSECIKLGAKKHWLNGAGNTGEPWEIIKLDLYFTPYKVDLRRKVRAREMV